MSVYVDNFNAPFGGMIMCHMIADTQEELLAMADRIGVKRKWIQHPGTYSEHFDVCLSKRKEAAQAGTVEVSPKDLVRKMIAKKTVDVERGEK